MHTGIQISVANRALFLATLAFAANFSVWILYAVFALELQETLAITSMDLGIIFAAPMLTGALCRIPAGILADRHNPKHLFTWQMLLTAPSLFLVPYASTFTHYILLGLWMGISGASFTIGIRYVSDWFDRSHQGTAMGIFGAGNAGAAITLALAPVLLAHNEWFDIGTIYGTGLIVMALLFAALAPSRPKLVGTTNNASLLELKSILSTLQVWRFGLYYYFVFGSFLALLMWLPQYYVHAYGLSFNQAMAFTLFFATTSSMVRALGGWFSDRYGGRAVNWNVFWISLVCLFFLSYPPTTMTIHGVVNDVNLSIELNVWVFSFFIFIMGIAQGFGRASVYKIIHDNYPHQMGTVGGIVAALGALGGATLPIVFGFAVDLVGIYSSCFMLLYGLLAACMIVMFFANKADRFQHRLNEAQAHNFLEME